MGCGISIFDTKEVVQVSANSSKTTTSHCFTGESKSNLVEPRPPNNLNNGRPSSSPDELLKKGTMTINVKHGGGETKFEDARCSNDDDENEKNDLQIFRGGSPSFREYCIDSDSASNSFNSEVYCEGDRCEWRPNQRKLNQEKEKGSGSEMVKKEKGGKGLMKALQRGRSGGKKNF